MLNGYDVDKLMFLTTPTYETLVNLGCRMCVV